MTPKIHFSLKQVRSLFRSNILPASLRKQLHLVRSERFQPYLVVAFTLWLVGAVEIIQKTGGQGINPRFWMLLAIVITIYSGVRVFRLNPGRATLAARKKRTRANEVVNRIHSSGFAVYQDPNEMNRDGYVIVGPTGVYALEVKERNVFGSRTIDLGRDNELVLGGRISDSRPLKQARAAAQKIGEGLRGVLKQRLPVKPLVVFLNDWQVNRPQSDANTPVVTENELPQYFSVQEKVLSESEVAQIATYFDRSAFAATC